MKISIIVPFKKGSFFLEDALQSLKEQTFRDFEVILVKDRVEEDISGLIDTFGRDFRMRVYELEEAKGVAAARNLGLSQAQGEYIFFLDSDDYLDENALSLLVDTADAEGADLVYGNKIWTWFSRSTFLANVNRNKDEDEEGEEGEDEENVDSSQMDVENGGVNERESSLEDEQILTEESSEEDEEDSGYDKRKMAYWKLVGKTKGIRNITVLNILIRRSLIEENRLKFNEDIIYLSDCPFVCQLLMYADVIDRNMEALYIKRNHNDPVNYPSLSQMPRSKNFMEYVNTYRYTVSLIGQDKELRERLDKKIIKYYVRFFAPSLRGRKNIEVRDRHFDIMHQLISGMDRELLRRYKGYKRKLLKALADGNINRTIFLVNRHLVLKKLKRILRNRRALAKFLYIHFFLKKPVKDNWVFCESFFGKSYSDSPKYIYEYLQENYPGRYRFIWVINQKNTHIPYKHTKVKRFSIRYGYYLARCRYYIFNGRQPEWIRKRRGNVFLQTWHGTPLKRLVFDMEDINSATRHYKKQTYKQSRLWDYLIAANKYSSDIFKRCFIYKKVMLETGYPRNDILHHKDREALALGIKDKLGIPKDKKTILYAPTWRDDEYYSKGKYKFSLNLDLDLMKEHLGSEYVVLLRTHYFIADNLDVAAYNGFAIDFSRHDDIAELYLVSDILITDYSSVFFDYANLKRPMLFFMYDLEKYRDILRGFYIDIEEELPGPILMTTGEVIDALNNLPEIEKKYEDKYKLFYDKFCAWEDGQASRRVVEEVFQPDRDKI